MPNKVSSNHQLLKAVSRADVAVAHKHRRAAMSSPAPVESPWLTMRALRRGGRGGGADGGQRSAMMVASYPVLLLLIILAALVKYVWIVLALYSALLLLLLSSASRRMALAQRLPSSLGGGRGGGVAAVTAAEELQGAAGRGGVSGETLASIPSFAYDAAAAHGGGAGEAAQCAVCLEPLRGRETARRLPACAHTFHVACIDMWLGSHATCPFCRCHVDHKPKGGLLLSMPPESPVWLSYFPAS